MKRRVFIHQSPKVPVGAEWLPVHRLAPGTQVQVAGRTYYIAKSGAWRRLYK